MVRDLLPCDIVSARELERQTFPGRWSAEEYLSHLSEPGHFCRVVGPKRQLMGAAWFEYLPGGKGFELTSFAVSPGLRGQGLGSQLIADLKTRVLPIWAWVLADNEKALRFYKREGFRRVRASKPDLVRVVWRPGKGGPSCRCRSNLACECDP